jgi:hypothetical protein
MAGCNRGGDGQRHAAGHDVAGVVCESDELGRRYRGARARPVLTIEEAERRGLPTEDPGGRKSSGFSAEHTAIAASRAVVEAVCYSRQKTANIAITDRTEASTPLLRVLDSAQQPGKTFERDDRAA